MNAHADTASLASDDGASTTDLRTSDPSVQGTLEGTSVGGATVEFDHDLDGDVDGTATANASGEFSYTPNGLAEGYVVLSARASGGAWRRIAFRYAASPDLDSASWLENQGAIVAAVRDWADSERPALVAYADASAGACRLRGCIGRRPDDVHERRVGGL